MGSAGVGEARIDPDPGYAFARSAPDRRGAALAPGIGPDTPAARTRRAAFVPRFRRQHNADNRLLAPATGEERNRNGRRSVDRTVATVRRQLERRRRPCRASEVRIDRCESSGSVIRKPCVAGGPLLDRPGRRSPGRLPAAYRRRRATAPASPERGPADPRDPPTRARSGDTSAQGRGGRHGDARAACPSEGQNLPRPSGLTRLPSLPHGQVPSRPASRATQHQGADVAVRRRRAPGQGREAATRNRSVLRKDRSNVPVPARLPWPRPVVGAMPPPAQRTAGGIVGAMAGWGGG